MELGNMIWGHSFGEYPMDRAAFEEKVYPVFTRLLKVIKCDGYGYYEGKDKSKKTKLEGFHCDLFEINPYYWGDCTCEANEDEEHKPDCLLMIPNFSFFPVGRGWETPLEIRWYKYPFRDSYANRKISPDELADIFRQCLEYVKQ